MSDVNKIFVVSLTVFYIFNTKIFPIQTYDSVTRRVKDQGELNRTTLGADLTRALIEGNLSSTPDPTGQTTYNNILEWLKPEYGDSWREIKSLVDSGNWQELRDAFYTNAKFGTAGMRGKMGVGPNRINIFAVRRVAQAVAEDLRTKFSEDDLAQRPYLICYDTRDGSLEFAQETASILAANGIKVAITPTDRPIGWFAHIIPALNGLGGLMITASHNPVGNNGIKLSAAYGGQLVPSDGQSISENYPKVALSEVKTMDYAQAQEQGLIVELGAAENEEYMASVLGLARDNRLTDKDRGNVRIIYDGLYGTDRETTPDALKELGYDVAEVEEHAGFDPQFTGLAVPNPTDPPALDLARRDGNEIIDQDTQWRQLTGDEQWTLISEYLFSRMQEEGVDLSQKTIVKSWVTTNMITKIAESFGVKVIETPVGFKWIGELGSQDSSIIAGFEESNGATLLAHSREKDGTLTASLMAEAIAWWNKQLNPGGEAVAIISNDADGDRLVVEVPQDSVVLKQLENIRRQYGAVNNAIDNTRFEGPEGMNQRDAIVDGLVSNPPDTLGDFGIVDVITEVRGANDGVRIVLEDGSLITLRKSGTEPIMRIYVETAGDTSNVLAAIKGYVNEQLALMNP